uniref:Uncharacterized protein n=1 Tax=Anopheles atroparvus TaxID=41427 RepID=A0A182IKP9_ANOAO
MALPLACRGLAVATLCAGDFCSEVFIGEAELDSASDWFSSSSLIDGSARHGPLFSVSSSASYPSRRFTGLERLQFCSSKPGKGGPGANEIKLVRVESQDECRNHVAAESKAAQNVTARKGGVFVQ